MRKVIRLLLHLSLAALLLFLVSGCHAVQTWWWEITDSPPSYSIPDIEYPTAGVDGVMRWTSDNISYVSDVDQYGHEEYWATPEQTYEAEAGDCEDYAILALWLLWRDLDIRGEFVGVVRRFDGLGHVLVGIDDALWDPVAGTRVAAEQYEELGRASAADAIAWSGREW